MSHYAMFQTFLIKKTVKMYKKEIKIVDGDTIHINKIKYRLIVLMHLK